MRLLPPNSGVGWTPYAWLVYLMFFVMYPAIGHASTEEWAYTALGICVFLPMYFWAHWLGGYRALWAVGGLAALGSVYAPFNPGASVFMVYAACFTGQIGESRIAFKYLGGLLVFIAAESWLLHLPPNFWMPALFFAALIGAVDIHFTQQRRVNRKLRLAQEEIEHLARLAERERIARDLHDVLGHTLSLIILKSELASKLADSHPERAVAEIRDVERISREALAEVRAAVKGYRSAGLDSELVHARQTLETAGIRVETAIDLPNLPPSHEGVLVLALREAVTNVVRHAQASSCRVRLEKTASWCELEVADDGRGGTAPEGSGLTGMRTRVEALGGMLVREPGRGTTLRIRLPLHTSIATSLATGAA
jgi:two-component system sensor histidine kinase DesK